MQYLFSVIDDTAGLATVTADVSALTSGQTAVALSACTTTCTFNRIRITASAFP